MKVALFLGAGASAPYGMPTTSQLKEILKESSFPFEKILKNDAYPDVEYILPALDKIISFSKSEGGKLWDICEPSSFRDVTTRAKIAKKIIEDEIFLRYKWNPSYDLTARELLEDLFSVVQSKDGDVTIFTTNFDTVIEEYCGKDNAQRRCITGFAAHRSRDMHVWSGDFQAGMDTRPKVFLYKLHGSLGWEQQNIDGNNMIVHKTGTRAAEIPANDVFIRPTINTKNEIAKDPYRTAINEFANKLPSFDVCVVIGYSFRDIHISKILVDFIQQGKTVVTLSPTAIVDFSKNALGETPTGDDIRNWSGKPVCSLKSINNDEESFYAINEKFDEAGISAVAHVLYSKPTEHSIGSIRLGR